MKIKLFVSLLFLLNNLSALVAQDNFQLLYGGADHDRAQSAFNTYNSGYLINGASFSFGSGDVDALFIKTDSAGQILWSNAYGTSGFDNSEYAIQASDSGFVAAGRGSNLVGANTFAMLFKTDQSGNILWSKSFGGTSNDGLVYAVETSQPGYAATGNSRSLSSGGSEVLFVNVDTNGDTLFTHTYGTADDESGSAVIQLPDNGFLIAGKRILSFGGVPVADGLLIRTDGSGNLLWSKYYGDSLWEEFNAVKRTADNGFIICGSTVSSGAGNFDILLVKTDSLGDVQWSKAIGGDRSDAGYDIHINNDSSFTLSGYTESLGHGHLRGADSTNMFLMKVDQNGDLLWTQTYGDGLQDEAYRSNKANDGGFLISGFTTNYLLNDSTQMIFIKTDSLGFSGCHEEVAFPADTFITIPYFPIALTELQGMSIANAGLVQLPAIPSRDDACLFAFIAKPNELASAIKIYPNPFQTYLNISSKSGSRFDKVVITDVLGRTVFAEKYSKSTAEISTFAIRPGIYFISVYTSENLLHQALIVKN